MSGIAAASPTTGDVERIAALPEPVLRNLLITQCYHELAMAFAARLGGNANWCAFATWASRQAGSTIRREDLRRHFSRAIDRAVQERGMGDRVIAAALAAGSRLNTGQLHAALRHVFDPTAALARTSEAVARGNLKVFAEIAHVFARFCATRLNDEQHAEAAIRQFCETLSAGEPPDGQDYLRRAFTHYYDALFETDAKRRCELLFLGNLEIGLHEQTRLQPEIAAALDSVELDPRAVTDQLIARVLPPANWLVRVRTTLLRVLRGPTPLERAVGALTDHVRRQLRLVLTEHFLTLELAHGAVLRLGQDLRANFPASLTAVQHAELMQLLLRIDPSPDNVLHSGATDWADLPERMHFICDFFRCHHERADLFAPPFTNAQVAALRQGQLPAGQL